MFSLVGLLIVLPLRRRIDRRALGRIAGAALALTLVIPILYAGALVAQPYSGAARPIRAVWPKAALSARMVAIWSEATHAPLRIVGGDDWVAGLVGLDASDRPSIYPDLQPSLALWITPERVAREGMLVLWEDRGRGMPPAMRAHAKGRAHGEETFAWSVSPKATHLKIAYFIIPPEAN